MYKYYFGYGANQNINYLIKRYNNYNFINYKIGIILNYSFKLCYSEIIDSVISTVVRDNNNIIYGVLYEISNEMLHLFDKQEHIDKNVYKRIKLPVIILSEEKIVEAYVYQAINDKDTRMASNFYIYKNIILDAVNNILDYPLWYKKYINYKFQDYYDNSNFYHNNLRT
ncbi:unknown similar to AMEV072 [Adoxophyes honmai entomopoxvirus 'L']|uniref:Gamma-glutamylcyclotransferase n=1 Tax=Adoxophyes honmai entomopoxvirus 'L' TaxID=1293540 RepID=A0A916KP17_9POXV|nr:unknown similar to AMEV072 [Adoxophyes honmai entomopoxvirus 'L']CCU55384.1 unknown similar to AMEV072 [Adoxophyes honmai entomopoxvirus 'L']